ncbi:hypothetical protein F5Y00DRAFT_268996 [Daldinia vernicosa]|uniref:uncharacterized protein n=1 Tax=Daldinia vernicosa TaxID=114800 RepID=UPI002007F875|nr:uncharacterized protein F5Y00DRAFT_268996 [Daldinia vernicosa]KAI0849577.1 hypothetical protein F5Y00DRAFT_268996 [Daldinia vernicosa]
MESATKHSGILDLPGEVLLMIFEEFKNFYQDPNMRNTRIYKNRNIVNVRLTCKKFCSVSSHLLLDSVNVEINLRSVQRFQDISKHPLIARGVRSIRILLHYHSGSLAENLSTYGIHQAQRIRDIVRALESIINRDYELYTEISLNRMREECHQGLKIAEAWQHLGQSNDEGLFERMARSGYDIYRSLYEEQELLREQRRFSRHVAEGIARMSGVRQLEFYDIPESRYEYTSISDLMEHDKIMNMLVSPLSWKEGDDYRPASPPCEIVFDLPLALRELRVQLTSLRIAAALYRPEINVPSQERSADLTAAMQSLRTFTYACNSIHRRPPWTLTYHYILAALNNSNIEEIYINYFSVTMECLFDQMIPRRDWPSLKKVELRYCYFHTGCLSRFLNGCNPAVFKYLGLHSMTWSGGADVLGILKSSCLDHFFIRYDAMGQESLVLNNEQPRWLVEKESNGFRFRRQPNIYSVARGTF